MAYPARSPAAQRQLGDRNMNIPQLELVPSEPAAQLQLKASVGFQVGKGEELSPRRQARRSLKPRKSILKSFSANSLEEYTGDYTNMTGNYGQIEFNENFTMGRQSLSRRVSFAPNAHVRMFDKDKEGKQSAEPTVDPNAHPSHGRRGSIHNLSQVNNPESYQQNQPVPQGRVVSADGDTDSEQDSDDDDRVQMGRPSVVPRMIGEAEEESDGEMDMDVTGVYGGVIRRQSMAADTSNMSIVTESDADEEKTMDFTIAIGGMLPNSPPVYAARNRSRSSIGYSLPQSPNSQNNRIIPGEPMEGEEMDMEMDETVAFGGIIGEDSTISSEGSAADAGRERTMTYSFGDVSAAIRDDTGMGMEMTVAMGGIINLPPVSPAPTSAPARPPTGTPSFARPTLSSAQRSREATPKEKRNVFAPSPSPFRSTTPRKTGMEVAKEVAQRLSFGSVTSSGGRKRAVPAEDEAERPSSAKKARLSVAPNVFAPSSPIPPPARVNLSASLPASTSTRTAPSPRKSLGSHQSISMTLTPQRRALPPKSPAKSPALRRMMGEMVLSGEGEDDEADWANETPPTISLTDFLEMAGVQFMEGLPTLNKRRSSVAKGILGQSYSGGDREFELHEYAEAQIHSVFLNMYTWAANKMKDDIQSGQADLRETDHICNLDNPPVIREYLSASDEDKALFEMTFKAFKTNTQLKARERWYDWKTDLMTKVRPDVEEFLTEMREDQERLDVMEEQTDAVLPDLQARLESLQKELEREREVIAEVAACDQDELAGLREGIAEQSTQINVFTAELEDSNAKLDVLQQKLDELEEKKNGCIAKINIASSKCDQYTRSDVLRIKAEFDNLQRLHLWKLESTRPDSIRMTYDDEVRLHIPRKNGAPVITGATVEKLERTQVAGPSKKRHGEDITQGMFAMFEDGVKTLSKSTTTLPLRTGQLWAAAQRVRSELGFVTMHFPTSYRLVDTPSTNGRSLIATVRMLIKSSRSKVDLCFLFDQSSLAGFPAALADVEVEAKAIYGTVNAETMKRAARATVSGITAEGYIGGLLQACVDASGSV